MLFSFFIFSMNAQKKETDIKLKASALEKAFIGERFRLVYTLINAEKDADIELPQKIKGFNIVYGPSVSTQMTTQHINGENISEYSKSFVYILEALDDGKLKLPVASVKANGKILKSNQIEINVLSSDRLSEDNNTRKKNKKNLISDSDAFVKPIVEEIDIEGRKGFSVVFRLFTQIELQSVSNLNIPDFSDFKILRERTPGVRSNMTEIHNGKEYSVIDLMNFVLLPTKSGRIKIGESDIELVFSIATGIVEQTFFGPVEKMQQVSKSFKIESFEVDAGLVGNWDLVYEMPITKEIKKLII